MQNYYFFPTLASAFECLRQFLFLIKIQCSLNQCVILCLFGCLHQFLFWSYQKKAVPLQRISKVEMVCVEELDNC